MTDDSRTLALIERWARLHPDNAARAAARQRLAFSCASPTIAQVRAGLQLLPVSERAGFLAGLDPDGVPTASSYRSVAKTAAREIVNHSAPSHPGCLYSPCWALCRWRHGADHRLGSLWPWGLELAGPLRAALVAPAFQTRDEVTR